MYDLLEAPSSLEAEQNLLGAIFLDNEVFDNTAGIIEEKDFYYGQNKIVYRAISELCKGGIAVDLITVIEKIDVHSDEMLPYVAEIVKNTASTSNAQKYAEIVKEKSLSRDLMAVGRKITELGVSVAPIEEKLAQAENMALSVSNKESKEESLNDCLQGIIAEIEYKNENKGKISGVPTSFDVLDDRFMGLQGGDMIVVAGRPSMGKTTLAMNIAEYNAVHKQTPILFFSLEMQKKKLVKRGICSLGGLHARKMTTGEIEGQDWNKLSMGVSLMKESQLIIEDKAVATMPQISSKARQHKRRNPNLGLVVIDYLQLIKGEGNNRVEQITNITRDIKLLAMSLDVPVIAVSQLNRSLEQRPNKRPIMSDLRDSGSIEQDADIIVFCYRDEVYNEDTPDKHIAEIITAKNRDGEIGTDRLKSELHLNRFANLNFN